MDDQHLDKKAEDGGAGGPVTPGGALAEDAFWQAGEGASALDDLPPASSSLQRLGPSPFARSGFPLVGFLATLYEHVAAHAQRRRTQR